MIGKNVLIDAHTHAWRPDDLRVLGQRLSSLDGYLEDTNPHKWYLRNEGTIEALLEIEKSAGIDRFVLLPVSSKPDKVSGLNRWVARMAEEHEEIIPFGTLVPGGNHLKSTLAELMALRLKGVKIHSFLQQINMTAPSTYAMFEALQDEDLTVLLDTMYLPEIVRIKPHLAPFLETGLPFQTDVTVIHDLARRYPRLKIIAAHMGCLYGWNLLEPLFEQENVYFDLAYVSRLLTPEKAMGIIRRKGVEHIIFGTDTPWRNPQNVVKWFNRLDISADERRLIAGENFLRLIKS